jgi:hypothetical protein
MQEHTIKPYGDTASFCYECDGRVTFDSDMKQVHAVLVLEDQWAAMNAVIAEAIIVASGLEHAALLEALEQLQAVS